MNEYEKLEFRVCLIGEEFVGKKSIIERFKNIKSTETLEFNKPVEIKQNKKEKKTKDKICDSILKPAIIPKIKYKYENLTNFTKIFRIEKNYFEINFYNIPPAEKVGFSDNLNEDDEVEKIHKMKFENVKNFFQNIINKPSKNNLHVRYLLIYVFDMTNAESLAKINVYYEQISKHIHFDKSYFRIIIGNKSDMRVPFENIDRDMLSSFIAQRSINYYEISAKLNFNFAGFFEKMFFDCFESTFPVFAEEGFKERFRRVLTCIKTVPQEDRIGVFKYSEDPGPERYNTNPYDISLDKG